MHPHVGLQNPSADLTLTQTKRFGRLMGALKAQYLTKYVTVQGTLATLRLLPVVRTAQGSSRSSKASDMRDKIARVRDTNLAYFAFDTFIPFNARLFVTHVSCTKRMGCVTGCERVGPSPYIPIPAFLLL